MASLEVLAVLGFAQVATGAGVARTFWAMWGAGGACDLCPAAITGIDQIGGAETLEVGGVDLLALTLGVGGRGSAYVWSFVPVQAEPA